MTDPKADEKRKRLTSRVLPLLQCVQCRSRALELRPDEVGCRECRQAYPVHRHIPIMTLQPEESLSYADSVVVENEYSEQWLDFVRRAEGEPVLDLGSGNNPSTHDHVIKLDVFPMPNVDVVGFAESLPFHDGAFRTVMSGAVFEHVWNPFLAIGEAYRVLRANGEVYIETAFLQPQHAFPNHYFNMTRPGLERLCQAFARIEAGVQPHQYPSFALHWLLASWAMRLCAEEREDFLHSTVAEIIQEYRRDPFSRRWLNGFTPRHIEELACGVFFHGRKPDTPEPSPRNG